MVATTPIFVIPPIIKHDRPDSDQQRTENRLQKIECKRILLGFLREAATYYQKGWYLEWTQGHVGEHLTANGEQITVRYQDKCIVIENGEYKTGVKMQAKLYYNKMLTMKEHGNKVMTVIADMMNRARTAKIASQRRGNNEAMSAYVLADLVKTHGFPAHNSANKGSVGYSPDASAESITFTYHAIRGSFTYRFNTTTGFSSLLIKDKYDELNLDGAYATGEHLAERVATVSAIASSFIVEFEKLKALVPKIVEYFKTGRE